MIIIFSYLIFHISYIVHHASRIIYIYTYHNQYHHLSHAQNQQTKREKKIKRNRTTESPRTHTITSIHHNHSILYTQLLRRGYVNKEIGIEKEKKKEKGVKKRKEEKVRGLDLSGVIKGAWQVKRYI